MRNGEWERGMYRRELAKLDIYDEGAFRKPATVVSRSKINKNHDKEQLQF